MTPERMKEAFDACRARILCGAPTLKAKELDESLKRSAFNSSEDWLSHMLYMCEMGKGFVDLDRIDKANRWLGFLQGALWMGGLATIDEMKHWNMPKSELTVRSDSDELT